jgi:hypothetical protein
MADYLEKCSICNVSFLNNKHRNEHLIETKVLNLLIFDDSKIKIMAVEKLF